MRTTRRPPTRGRTGTARHGTARRVIAGAAALGLAGALTCAVAGSTPAHAEVTDIQVTTTGDSGPGSLREALAQAAASPTDDRVTFAPTVTGTIQLTSGQLGVTVGGSSGDLTVEGPGRDVLGVDAGTRSRVLDVHGPGGDTRPSMVVSGLTLTGGYAGLAEGGALRASGTDLTLAGMRISDSRTSGPGGGVSLRGGSLVVEASRVSGNHSSATSWGTDLCGAGGGGIFFDGGEAAGTALEVRGSAISANTADNCGGGIDSQGPAPVTVAGSTVSDNTAAFTWVGMEAAGVLGDGGGISARHLTVSGSRITGNEAGRHGGGLAARAVVVTGSTIADNDAGRNGGGVHVEGDHPELVSMESSTVTGNRADIGGGLHLAGATPTMLTLSTVAANAAVEGGGLFSIGQVHLQGSIVAMNAGGDLRGDGPTTRNHSLVGRDPRLGALRDHGGPTRTLLPASNSPVIDQGSRFGATTDQRGFPRPVDGGAADAMDGSDVGAIELTPAELAGPAQVGNTARPTIAGRVRVGRTLRTDGGAWRPRNVPVRYQWLRDGEPIAGATSASYTIRPRDFGRNMYGDDQRKRISVRVTAEPRGPRPAVAESDYTSFVARGVLRMDGRPRVDGRTRVGSVLRARPRVGAISPRPLGVRVQWYLDGRHVDHAYGDRRLRLGPRTRGKKVKVSFVYTPPEAYRPLRRVVTQRRPVR